MRISESSLDDLMLKVLKRLLSSKSKVTASRGSTSEAIGVLLELKNPRARLCRSETKRQLFSAMGELCWYLSGSDSLKFIQYYLSRYDENTDNGRTIHGAYGPRLLSHQGQNQIVNVRKLLTQYRTSRRAVVQLFDAADLAQHYKDVPCTCTFQFLARGKRLEMITTMRSNDAFVGLPHDVFTFTMIQELMARAIGLEVGTYRHFVGSLHLYDEHRLSAEDLIDEGWQQTALMPPMPLGDPFPSLRALLKIERAIRLRRSIDLRSSGLDQYWKDLARLLQIFSASKERDGRRVSRLKKAMSSRVFDPYIDQRHAYAERPRSQSGTQQPLFAHGDQ